LLVVPARPQPLGLPFGPFNRYVPDYSSGRHYSKLESDGGKAPTVLPGRIGPLGEEVDPFYSVNRRYVVIPSSQLLALPIGLFNRCVLDYDSGRRYSLVD
jgi:hypothetical protein